MKRVRANTTYVYDPVLLDRSNPPVGNPERGDLVKVKALPGCPKPGTMGMCHVVFADDESFAGLVCVNSLVSRGEWKERMREEANDEA
jgi:hypothetical protein